MARIAQISDTHVTVGSDAAADALTAAITQLGRLWPQPGCLLITGDLVDRGLPAEYARLRALLEGLPLPVFLIPGNHDNRDALRAAFAGWPEVLGGDDRCGPFIQYAIDLGAARIVMHDSTDPLRGGGVACPDRLARLDALLAERPHVPTVLAMHHPPFRTYVPIIDSMPYLGLDELEQVVARHRHVVRIIAGHVHRPITAEFAGTVAISCGSTFYQATFGLAGGHHTTREPAYIAIHMVEPNGSTISHSLPVGDY